MSLMWRTVTILMENIFSATLLLIYHHFGKYVDDIIEKNTYLIVCL